MKKIRNWSWNCDSDDSYSLLLTCIIARRNECKLVSKKRIKTSEGHACNPRLMTIYLAPNTQTNNQVAFSFLYVETRLEL